MGVAAGGFDVGCFLTIEHEKNSLGESRICGSESEWALSDLDAVAPDVEGLVGITQENAVRAVRAFFRCPNDCSGGD